MASQSQLGSCTWNKRALLEYDANFHVILSLMWLINSPISFFSWMNLTFARTSDASSIAWNESKTDLQVCIMYVVILSLIDSKCA